MKMSHLYWHGGNFGGQTLAEKHNDGSWSDYIFAAGARIGREDNQGRVFYHQDHLGSTRLQTDASGNPLSPYPYEYYPFGQLFQTGSEHYLFTGKERDAETGLDYFGARHYGSNMGRFMQADPSGVAFSRPSAPQSWNLYSYVQNSPMSSVDPDGRECVWEDGSFDSKDDKETGSAAKCGRAGGVWFEPSTFTAGNGQDWSDQPNADLAQMYADTMALRDSLPSTPGYGESSWSGTSSNGMNTTIDFGGAIWQTTQFRHGNHPYRNNNPGDIVSGRFTRNNGAIGADGRFAVFPTFGTGMNALDTLLHGSGYINLSINDAVARYAPAFENNTAGYQQFLMNVVGAGGNTPLSSLSPVQFSAFERGIASFEGFNARGGYSVTVTTVISAP